MTFCLVLNALKVIQEQASWSAVIARQNYFINTIFPFLKIT